jgi:tetraprenyl-beta-curcumene synthase
VNPSPLSPRQFVTLVAVLGREFAWVKPNVAEEVRVWRKRAEEIPDQLLRRDALQTLEQERLNAEGAAFFTVLPAKRHRSLLRLLVAYQIALDYLDTITERPAPDSYVNGMQLHRALTDALDPAGPISDYYRYRPDQDDGGYLKALVDACRGGCAALPGYLHVQTHTTRAATRLAVQVLNHDPDTELRQGRLEEWAQSNLGEDAHADWFELTAAASSTLGLYALLALAVDADVDADEVARIDQAYHPWICLACTLLDGFVDQEEDRDTGNNNYFTYYPEGAGAERLCAVVSRATLEARALRNGRRHAVVTTAMISMYLSKDAAYTPELRSTSDRLKHAAGSLAVAQLPILRLLRRALA